MYRYSFNLTTGLDRPHVLLSCLRASLFADCTNLRSAVSQSRSPRCSQVIPRVHIIYYRANQSLGFSAAQSEAQRRAFGTMTICWISRYSRCVNQARADGSALAIQSCAATASAAAASYVPPCITAFCLQLLPVAADTWRTT